MAMIKIFFSGPGRIPERKYPNDAAFDLYTYNPDEQGNPATLVIGAGEFMDIPCGVAMEAPFNHWGLILGRSSSIRSRGLQVYPGVIDPGFRGDLFVGALNITKRDVTVDHGERIGQLILFENRTMLMTPFRAERLTESERGTNGFGSSGS